MVTFNHRGFLRQVRHEPFPLGVGFMPAFWGGDAVQADTNIANGNSIRINDTLQVCVCRYPASIRVFGIRQVSSHFRKSVTSPEHQGQPTEHQGKFLFGGYVLLSKFG